MRRGVLFALVLTVAVSAALPGTAAAGPCTLETGLVDLTEGRTEPKLKFPRASHVKVLFLFVDFSDGAGDPEVPSALAAEVGDQVSRYYSAVSYGRANYEIAAVREWIRMPRPASFYELEEAVDHDEYVRYLKDVIAVADAKVDFSEYTSVQVFNPAGVGMTRAHAFATAPGEGLPTGDGELRFAAGSSDSPFDRNGLAMTIVHELGHNVGLPDLYDVGGSFEDDPPDLFRFAGLWDVMSGYTSDGTRMLAWHRLKLGWLRSSEVRCFTRGSARATLAPVDSDRGKRALVARVSSTRAWVAEARPPSPGSGCSAGVLFYRVDANVETGDGPVRIATSRRAPVANDCAALAEAPFRPLRRSSYVTGDGVRLDVIRRSGDGYVVRVRMGRRGPFSETPPPPDSRLTTVLP